MKRTFLSVALSLAAVPAFAADGYVTGNVNLRAGPDVSYPSVDMLRAGTSVVMPTMACASAFRSSASCSAPIGPITIAAAPGTTIATTGVMSAPRIGPYTARCTARYTRIRRHRRIGRRRTPSHRRPVMAMR
jgi:hypothetical protein